MNVLKKLDLAIKELEGYDSSWSEKYCNYMSKSDFEEFKSKLPQSAIDEYGKGSGGELKEKDGRPPKMASYGSSSRLVCRLSYDKEGFEFEKKLPTGLGGVANLDGFIEQSDRYVFVEAKCREPYHKPYSESPVKVSRAYEGLYEYITENTYSALNCVTEPIDEKNMIVRFDTFGDKIEYFDLKQIICHMLGIAKGVLEGRFKDKCIDIIYVVYNPTDLVTDEPTKQYLTEVYERLCYECNTLDLTQLFTVLLTYLRDEKGIGDMSDEEIDSFVLKFTVYLSDQDFYGMLLG